MKSSAPVPAFLCALFLALLSSGSIALAHAAPHAANLIAVQAQDAAPDSSAPSVTGSWQLSFSDMQGNPRQAMLQITQNDTHLSGTFQGQRGSGALSGDLQKNHVSMTVKAHGKGIFFTGTITGNTMSGTTAQGSKWSATRQ